MMAEQYRIVIVGHVDHGKSTFVGRLFHDTGSLPDGKLEQLQRAAERRGTPFEWANLMDALQAERAQNITIDTAQIWFRTPQRQYVIIDAPGHREFLKNMVTGASHAQAAIVLIDAGEGVQEQTRRHGYLLQLLGIHEIVVLVNKMDLVGYSQARFEELENEYRAFLASVDLAPQLFIPIAARDGDNIASRSDRMPWWQGATVLAALDTLKAAPGPEGSPLRFPVQDVYRFDERRIIAGRIESGTVRIGDRLIFSPGGKTSTVKSIERWSASETDVAGPGESVGLTLTEQVFVERGVIASHEHDMPVELNRFKGRIFWLGHAPMVPGRAYKLKLTTQETPCEIESIDRVIDASTLASTEGGNAILRHEVAELTLRTRNPVAFDPRSDLEATGRFVIVDGFEVSGGGIVLDDNYPRRREDGPHKSENIYWSSSKVTATQRAHRNLHPGCVVWLTGLSGSGKSTIAVELERELFIAGSQAYVLDGDNVRHGLCSDLGFSARDRTENIRRVGEMAKLFADAGMICITAFISPYRADRDRVRQIMHESPGRFIEVFLNTPLEVCETRDPKGLYARARAQQIPDFTGVSAPYEAPEAPEIELRTDQLSIAESVTQIMDNLRRYSRARDQ